MDDEALRRLACLALGTGYEDWLPGEKGHPLLSTLVTVLSSDHGLGV